MWFSRNPLDPAAMSDHHLPSNGKAKARAVKFGGLEEAELLNAICNSRTRILDQQAKFPGCRNLRSDQDLARSFADRLHSVLHQVVQNAPQLFLVRVQRRQVRRKVHTDAGTVCGGHWSPKVDDLLQKHGNIDPSRLQPLLAGKGHELAHERLEPAHLEENLFGGLYDSAECLIAVAPGPAHDELRGPRPRRARGPPIA